MATVPTDHGLILLALGTIGGVVLLIARFRCPTVVALLLASLAMGLGAGLPLLSDHLHPSLLGSIATGVWRSFAGLAPVIVLGAILGQLMAASGAAEIIALALLQRVATRHLDYALMCLGFVIGISVFFGVGVMLLGPLAFMLARKSGLPLLRLALPLVAGLSVAHGLIPPHPGPMAAIALVRADVGRTIMWSVLIGLPTALVAGPLVSRALTRREVLATPGKGEMANQWPVAPRPPGLTVSLFTLLLPVLLMLLATSAELAGFPHGHPLRRFTQLVGSPIMAMLVATVFATWTLGGRCGFQPAQLWVIAKRGLGPATSIALVIAAGGGFSEVLHDTGVGESIARLGALQSCSPILLGWMIAALLRVAVGSATVAVIMASSLMLPVLGMHPETNRELLVLALGAGSLVCSHVNDSGFWLIKVYFGLTTSQTLRTWTIVETSIGVTALLIILGANALH